MSRDAEDRGGVGGRNRRRWSWGLLVVGCGLLLGYLFQPRTDEERASPSVTAVEEPGPPRVMNQSPVRAPPPPAPSPSEPTDDTAEPELAPDPESPVWTIRCPLGMDAPFSGEVEFVEIIDMGHGVIMPTQVEAHVVDGQLLVAAGNARHSGWVEVPGYADLAWSPAEEGGCPELTLKGRSGVVGRVVPAWGDVSVSACGSLREADEEGNYYIPASPGRCQVHASRRESGDLYARSAAVEVEVVDGEDVVLDLRLPEERRGTLGMTLETVEEVVQVATVRAGSVAAEAGLEVGDVIVRIDGDDPRSCDRGWLYNCFHGALGSVVSLEMGDGELVELHRSVLPDQEADE